MRDGVAVQFWIGREKNSPSCKGGSLGCSDYERSDFLYRLWMMTARVVMIHTLLEVAPTGITIPALRFISGGLLRTMTTAPHLSGIVPGPTVGTEVINAFGAVAVIATACIVIRIDILAALITIILLFLFLFDYTIMLVIVIHFNSFSNCLY
jgi:hypothetical protein